MDMMMEIQLTMMIENWSVLVSYQNFSVPFWSSLVPFLMALENWSRTGFGPDWFRSKSTVCGDELWAGSEACDDDEYQAASTTYKIKRINFIISKCFEFLCLNNFDLWNKSFFINRNIKLL